MDIQPSESCLYADRIKERNRIGVWGFGNVSRDVVLTLVEEGLGKEIVFYGRPKEGFPNRAKAWIEDLRANSIHRPRITGTNNIDDMAGLDAIFIGVGAPRRPGQTRSDLLEINTRVIAEASLEIKNLYSGCGKEDAPVLIYMGNPVTAMTWVGYKATGFPRQNIMGQAGNLDSRRICHAISLLMNRSANDMKGIVFGEHGDSMVASTRYFSIGGIPLDDFARAEGIDPSEVDGAIAEAKKGGTHFVNETGQSASAGPARAAVEMLRCVISGESETQPVISILEKEYNLIDESDNLESIAYGVPARIGPYGVEKIYELPVDDIRDQIERSAAFVKDDIRAAKKILAEKFQIF